MCVSILHFCMGKEGGGVVLDVGQECFISETERGNWTVEVELDCIISSLLGGEDKMFTQLRPNRNLIVSSSYSVRTLKHTRVWSSSGDIFMTKTAFVIIIICVRSHSGDRKKRGRWKKKKSHTQTHPHKPRLTKNHLLALRLHAWPKLKFKPT